MRNSYESFMIIVSFVCRFCRGGQENGVSKPFTTEGEIMRKRILRQRLAVFLTVAMAAVPVPPPVMLPKQ